YAATVFVEQPRRSHPAPSRPIRHRVDDDGRATTIDHDEPEAQASAELAHRRRPMGPGTHGKVDGFRERQPLDALEHERQPERALELDDERRLVAADGDD